MPELSNDPRFLTAIVPAASMVATADELSRFYQLLLNGGTLDGVDVFDRRTIRRATVEQSYLEFDFTLGIPLRYGMGFMLGAEYLSFYGPHTRYAFGHLGFTNVDRLGRPERDVAAALLTSGKPLFYPASITCSTCSGRSASPVRRSGRVPSRVGRETRPRPISRGALSVAAAATRRGP